MSRNVAIAAYQKDKRAAAGDTYKRVNKDYQLRHKFDLTLVEYEELLKEQNQACAICGKADGSDKHSGERTKQLSVDHNHTTGVVRGLLCNDCNRAIGQLQDSPVLLRKAAEYLEWHEEKRQKAAKVASDFLDELTGS